MSMVQPLEQQHLICLKVKEKPNQQSLLTGKNKYAIKETTQSIIIHVILTIIPYKVLLFVQYSNNLCSYKYGIIWSQIK